MNTKYLAAAAASLMLAASVSAHAEGKNGVAAVVNGEKVTVAEIRKIYDGVPQIHTQEKWDTFYGKALDAWVSSRALLQAANKSDVRKSAEYRKQLEAAGNDIAARLYMKQELEKQIDEKELKRLYDQYKTNFVSEKEIKARHILVDNENVANDVVAKIAKGENFDELAKQYSKEKRIDLGYFTKDMMVPDFGNVAFSMKKGEFSQKPIKTQFGYHIIVVDDVRNSQPLSYKDAEPQLKAILAQEAAKKLLSTVGQNAKIEKYSLDGKMIK